MVRGRQIHFPGEPVPRGREPLDYAYCGAYLGGRHNWTPLLEYVSCKKCRTALNLDKKVDRRHYPEVSSHIDPGAGEYVSGHTRHSKTGKLVKVRRHKRRRRG